MNDSRESNWITYSALQKTNGKILFKREIGHHKPKDLSKNVNNLILCLIQSLCIKTYCFAYVLFKNNRKTTSSRVCVLNVLQSTLLIKVLKSMCMYIFLHHSAACFRNSFTSAYVMRYEMFFCMHS